jgi:hypothetical protein
MSVLQEKIIFEQFGLDERQRFRQNYLARKARQRLCAWVLYSALAIQIVIIIYFLMLDNFRGYPLGSCLVIYLTLINFTAVMVYVNIIKSVYRPSNDPGILIWWLCCVNIGKK